VISGWLIKVLVGIALVGFLVVELGSPLIARAQADDAAHEVANEVAFELRNGPFTKATMDNACQTEAPKHAVTAVCTFDNGRYLVNVTVHKQARSVLFKKIGAMKDWYDVTASATASPK